MKAKSIPVIMDFAKQADELKLEKVEVPQNLARIITQELIVQCMKSASTAQSNLRNRTVTVQLDNVDFNLLPDQTEITAIFGSAKETNTNGTVIYNYTYTIAAADRKNNPLASIKLSFLKKSPKEIGEIIFKYRAFQIMVDVEQRKAVLHVR